MIELDARAMKAADGFSSTSLSQAQMLELELYTRASSQMLVTRSMKAADGLSTTKHNIVITGAQLYVCTL